MLVEGEVDSDVNERRRDLVKVGREAVGVVLSGGTERAKAQRQGAWGLNGVTKRKRWPGMSSERRVGLGQITEGSA